MPELPEVETVRRQLAAALPGRRILAVAAIEPAMLRDVTPETLAAALPGRRILAVDRRGKFILLILEPGAGAGKLDDSPLFLTIHLGMTGQLLLQEERPSDTPVGEPTADPGRRRGAVEARRGSPAHDRFVFLLSDPVPGPDSERDDPSLKLVFRDMRKFGRVELGRDEPPSRVARMGPDAWPGGDWDAEVLAAALAGRRAPLKAFLLDQRRLAGIGNIYADEILFGAGLSPLRPAGSLDRDEIERLAQEIKARLDEGVRLRGCSISDFVDTLGSGGGFQRTLRAYGRQGQPCVRCGGTLVRVVVAGRGTAYCPGCQR